MITKNIYTLLVALMLGVAFLSCSDMNELHEPFLQDGEQIYVGKPLDVQYFPGNNRIKFSWTINADPKITKALIKWRDSEDRSVEFPVSPGPGTIEKVIENIPEGGYNFDVYMLGDNGERSVKVQLTGVVYGEKYQSGISNPLSKPVYYNQFNNPNKELDLEWLGVSDQVVVVDIKYTNNSDQEMIVHQNRTLTAQGKLAPFAERTILSDYQDSTEIWFRTGFLPSTAAIDTFYTEYKKLTDDRTIRMIRPGIYKILARHSGKALKTRDNADGSPNPNANAVIEQNTYDNKPTFKWKLKYNIAGYAVLTNTNSNLDMAVTGASVADAANVVQIAQLAPTELTCNCHDEWTISSAEATNQYFKIANRNSTKVAEVVGGSANNGISVQQRGYSGATHQQFEFILL